MSTPTYDQVRIKLWPENIRIPQNVENGVGNAFGTVEIEAGIAVDFIVGKNHVTQHREQVLVDALDHHLIDKGGRWRPFDVQLDSALPLDDPNRERAVPIEQLFCVIELVSAIQDGE